LHATRYRGATSGGELVWKHRPATSMQGRCVLLVDDIVDEGHTLAAIRDWCREQGAADVRIAALAVKVHDRCVPGLSADYMGVEVPDRYVYGYGMDFHEQGRGLPAIYALKD
ncbi:MAG TPA: phosphoribosyltransferase family protein, partial [Lysobacter sp.]